MGGTVPPRTIWGHFSLCVPTATERQLHKQGRSMCSFPMQATQFLQTAESLWSPLEPVGSHKIEEGVHAPSCQPDPIGYRNSLAGLVAENRHKMYLLPPPPCCPVDLVF